MKPLDRPDELQSYYQDSSVVAEYIARRTAQPLNGVLHSAQVRFLNSVIRERQPRRILEIAPGPGRLTAEMDFDGPGVAIDASPGMLATARKRVRAGAKWSFVRGDAFALPFPDRAFDFVYSLKLVRHFRIAERQRLYAEIRRVLAPGGAFVIDAQNRAVSLPHRLRKGLDRYVVYDVLYDRAELLQELSEAGFRSLRVEGILGHFALQRTLNRLRRVRLGALARTLIEALEHVPSSNPSTWMVLNELA